MAFTNAAFLKFNSEQEWNDVAKALGVCTVVVLTDDDGVETGEVEEQWLYYTHDWAVDVIGIIYDPGTYDDDGNELTPPVAHDGWHVNTKWKHSLPTTLANHAVSPATPRRVFAGD